MTIGEPNAKHPKDAHTSANNNAKKDARMDRHSADVKSTVQKDAKKHGHGGGFTWDGDATEQLNDTYTSDVHGKNHMQGVSLTEEAPRKRATTDDESFKGNVNSLNDFPKLGPAAAHKSPEQKADESKWHGKVMLDMDFAEKVAA